MPDEHARDPSEGALVVDGVTVAPPLTEGQARALASAGLLAGDVDGLLAAWSTLESTWAATVDRARTGAGDRLEERVDGEWSFVETLRHLVFVTDVWLGGDDVHRLGLPPDFAEAGFRDRLDLEASPTLDEVLAVRAERQAIVRRAIASGDLDGRSGVAEFSRRGALQVVVAEEAFHHGFAVRDLGRLGG